MPADLTQDQKDIVKILVDNEFRVTKAVAEDIVDQIALDGAYSSDEQELLQFLRDTEILWFSRGTEAFMNRLISNLNLRFHRERSQAAKLASLDQAILSMVGTEAQADQAKAEAVYAYIAATGYSEQIQATVQYLYSGDRFTADAKAWLKKQIAVARALRAHKAWVAKSADSAIVELLGGNFIGAKIDMAKAVAILDILFADWQYSDAEKETMHNLYRNAEWAEGTKEYVQDEIHTITNGTTLDGSIVDHFLTAVDLENNDRAVDAEEAGIIIKDAQLGTGLSQNKLRTLQYCIQTFNVTTAARNAFNTAIEGDKDVAGEKRNAKTDEVAAAAEAEKEVEVPSTKEVIKPSRTLMAAYKKLKNKRGQITAYTADEFIDVLLSRGYSKNKQATMRILRDNEAFTDAANREILLAIRQHVASKNFDN
jgi:hypothetical protein